MTVTHQYADFIVRKSAAIFAQHGRTQKSVRPGAFHAQQGTPNKKAAAKNAAARVRELYLYFEFVCEKVLAERLRFYVKLAAGKVAYRRAEYKFSAAFLPVFELVVKIELYHALARAYGYLAYAAPQTNTPDVKIMIVCAVCNSFRFMQ